MVILQHNLIKKFLGWFLLFAAVILTPGCYNGDTDTFLQAFDAAELDIVSIAINEADLVIETGQNQSYTVTATQNSGGTIDITDLVLFSVTDSAVATIDSEGQLSGVAVGNIQVNASFANFDTSTNLEVSDRPLQSISISFVDDAFDGTFAETDIPVCSFGYQLQAIGDYSLAADGSDERVITDLVTWTSGVPSVAIVDENASLLSLSVGTAGIEATRSFPDTTPEVRSNSLTTTSVGNLNAGSIDVTRENGLSNSSIVVNTSRQYIAQATYTIAGVSPDPTFEITETATWSTTPVTTDVIGDPNVDGSKGLVSAEAVGTVDLVASCAGESGSIAIDVIATRTLTSIRIDNDDEQTEKIDKNLGDSDFQLRAFAVFSDSTEEEITDDSDITWRITSGGEFIDVDNSDGNEGTVSVNAVGVGIVEILYEGLEDTIVIEVEE